QDIDAIMNSVVSDTDELQLDDLAGAYFLYSGDYNTGGVGDEDDHGGLWVAATGAVPGGVQEGTLGFGDYDVFRVELATAGSLVLQTTGEADTYCILYREDGTIVDFDDDSGTSFNFRIVAPFLEAGIYYVEVS